MNKTERQPPIPFASLSGESLPPGAIITIAGSDYDVHEDDGRPATEIALFNPVAVCGDGQGCFYIVDNYRSCIQKIDRNGAVHVIAGTGEPGYSGDGGPALEAALNHPSGITLDHNGNLYLADTGNNRVREIDIHGVITTVAGTGEPGYSGDGGPAIEAALIPFRLCMDNAGHLYISDDRKKHCIRKIDIHGVITTVAGTGEPGYSGDGGPAVKAQLHKPEGLRVDCHGNLYIADRDNHRVRKVDTRGMITTVAGTGETNDWGDGGPAIEAAVSRPSDIRVDGEGRLFILSSVSNYVRKVDRRGIITTLTGDGFGDGLGRKRLEGDNGPAIDAALFFPLGTWSDRTGNLYIAERESHSIRKVDIHGKITTVAGTGKYGYSGDGGPAIKATLCLPSRIWGDDHGALYIADSGNHRIRRVDESGMITTLAGTGKARDRGDGGPARRARLDYPYDLWGDGDGNLYIVSKNTARIRRVDASGMITTVAGTGEPGYSGDDGPASEARLDAPRGVCLDRSGNLYIADRRNHRIRRVDRSGTITTVVGTGARGSEGDDGPAIQATLFFPTAVFVDQDDHLFISEWGSYYVRRVDANGVITTVAGKRGEAWAGRHTGPTELNHPSLWGDEDGNFYIVDRGSRRIIKRSAAGVFSTLAGTGQPCVASFEGYAVQTRLYRPGSLWGNAAGHLYIVEYDRPWIRKISPDGMISMVVGSGIYGNTDDRGETTEASLKHPFDIWGDADGRLYIVDTGSERVLSISPTGEITVVAGTGKSIFTGDGGPAVQANIVPRGICGDESGNLYIIDVGNARIRKIDRDGIITTVAGDGFMGPDGQGRFSGDGGPAIQASLGRPTCLYRDDAGNLYIADLNSHRIRRVDNRGVITTIAGNGEEDFSQDGTPATMTDLNSIIGLCVDYTGNLYFSDYLCHRVRKIDTNGILSTVAGTGVIGYTGDGGPAMKAALQTPNGLFIDRMGNLYIADCGNQRIRKVIRVACPIIEVYPEELDCGAVAVGSVGEAFDLSISNRGFVRMRATIRCEHPAFIVHPTLLEIPPESARAVRVWFNPVEETGVTGGLTIESDDPATPVVCITLRGQGVRRHDTLQITAVAAAPGSAVRAPARIHATHPVAGLQFRVFQESPDRVRFSHFHSALESEKFRAVSTTYEGLTTVIVYSIDGFTLPSGRHALGDLVFHLDPQTPQGTIIPLRLRNILLSDASEAILPAAGVDGAILAEQIGALSHEGATRLLDLLRLVRVLLDQQPAPPSGSLDFATIDANGDGLLNLQDVAAFSQRIYDGTEMASPETPASAAILIPDVIQESSAAGHTLLSVRLQTRMPVSALQLALTWDAGVVTIHKPRVMGRASGMTGDYALRDGALRMILYSAAGRYISPGDGPILRIPVAARYDTPDAPPVTFSSITAVGPSGHPIETICSPDTVVIETPPAAFRLRANRPDPFIVETRIPYDVPQPAQVTLVIFNPLEEEVIRLVDEPKQPGRHSVVWDGLDRQGKKLDTGTYYCRMTTSAGFTGTRRLRLIR